MKRQHTLAILLSVIVYLATQQAQLTAQPGSPLARGAEIGVVTCTLADTEYAYAVPVGALGIQYVADGGTIRYAYEAGVLDGAPASTDAYMELTDTQSDGDLNVRFYGITMYFASPTPGTQVRIKVFKY